jgi:uncharacterized protein (TIGR02600 family)
MRDIPQIAFPRHSRTSAKNGAALILVLGFVMLITAFGIAFFSSATTELIGANKYAGGVTAKQLADSTVQTVIGTIKLATSGTDASGQTLAWASQPGMIRTYDSAGGQVAYYKLYSSGSMVLQGSSNGFDPSGEWDSGWASKPALFTDLNAPIIARGKVLFPIIDGNAITTLTKTGSSGETVSAYLGYNRTGRKDDAGTLIPDVEGFKIDPSKVNYAAGSDLSTANTPVPMPVKWIYVLQDGTLIVPDASSSDVATFENAGAGKKPTASNPITGRIAFWTDDECSKVNINTASEGTYWDVPKTVSLTDFNLSDCQPVTNEFQRYPGHPAMTSLSPILGSLWSGTDTNTMADAIYGIAPRIVGGGSKGGTVATGEAGLSGTTPALSTDRDRLYATVDELMFQPTSTSGSRSIQLQSNEQLEQSRFFITANSRAPDVNLFNKPRVCIWPISATNTTNYRTGFDNIIAFCSTMRNDLAVPYLYYFQRDDSNDPFKDLPTAPAATVSDIRRNKQLLTYLHNLTAQSIPGFGGSFQTKYNTSGPGTGTECDQILTEIFDYIRCVNLSDAALPIAGRFATGGTNTSLGKVGQGQVVPIQDADNGTRGLGRFPTVSKAFFHFIGNATNPPPPATVVTVSGTNKTIPLNIDVAPAAADMNPYNSASNTTGLLYGKTRVQAGFFLEFFNPAQGFIYEYPRFTVKVSNLDTISWGPTRTATVSNVNLNRPATTGTVMGDIVPQRMAFSSMTSGTFTTPGLSYSMKNSSNQNIGPTQASLYPLQCFAGGNMGYASSVLGYGWNGGYVSGTTYPFVASTSAATSPIAGKQTVTTSDIDVDDTIYFSGGTITYEIYTVPTTGGTAALAQKGTLYFPSATFPCPTLAPVTVRDNKAGNSLDTPGNFRYFVTGTSPTSIIGANATAYGGRLCSAGNVYHEYANWIIDTDVVQSIEIASGDPRIAAARAEVPSSMYRQHANYGTSAMAHSLRSPTGYPYYGATFGRLVSGLDLKYPKKTDTSETYNGTRANGYPVYHVALDWGVPSQVNTASGIMVGGPSGTVPGDWDNGYGYTADGPYINKADEGDSIASGIATNGKPYYSTLVTSYTPSSTLFSPNRQIASAVTFGSLPSGVFANKPWQTLLFRSLPVGHPGLGTSISSGNGDSGPPYSTPPDHLLLDLFSMPIVEPYPISEPLSTAGRINMNYQIVPFSYINRDTGIRAVMKSEKIIAIPDSASAQYKYISTTAPTTGTFESRYPINMDETLIGFTNRFDKHDIFRSASEICGIHLVPQITGDANATYANMSNFWNNYRLTGDNSRERPYATIYPRLTTKSNTFTVHFRVQTLRKTKTTDPAKWVENRDVVEGEYRGSQMIERYVDPNDGNLPDYALPAATPLDAYYRFRILNSKKFTP